MSGSVLAKKSSWRVLPSWGACGVATSKARTQSTGILVAPQYSGCCKNSDMSGVTILKRQYAERELAGILM